MTKEDFEDLNIKIAKVREVGQALGLTEGDYIIMGYGIGANLPHNDILDMLNIYREAQGLSPIEE